MQRMIVNIENCYGIGKLAHEFDFNPANPNPDQATRAYSIYAANGFMKTSLSKTFQDLIKGDKSSDLINPERASTRTIQDENGVDIKGENVFVIEPYNQDFTSEKTSLLLVNQTLKKQYDEALLKIEEKKNALLKKLKQLSGLTGKTITPETELLKCFGQTSIYDLFESLESEIQKQADDRLAVITCNELFNDKVVSLLESGTIRIQLKDYIEKYNDLVDKSPILSKTFNHYHAKTVHKNLSENGFFSAQHSVNLFNGVDREEITSGEALEARIEDEKKRILSNEDLNKKFEEIDKKLTTKELREFRDYLLENKDVVAELAEYKKLQKAIWVAYLSSQKDDVNDFLLEYRKGKEVIQKAIDAARSERTEWEEVVKMFNERFSVPFRMGVAIPRVKSAADFWAFSQAGRKLAEVHLNYETVEPYPLKIESSGKLIDADYRVVKMKYGKTGKDKDLTTLHYNDKITLTGIPLEAYDYIVNGKPALDWVVERQCVKTDKDSGIVNDANDWAVETMGNPRYPLELFMRVVTVSLETMKIVNGLPKLDI